MGWVVALVVVVVLVGALVWAARRSWRRGDPGYQRPQDSLEDGLREIRNRSNDSWGGLSG